MPPEPVREAGCRGRVVPGTASAAAWMRRRRRVGRVAMPAEPARGVRGPGRLVTRFRTSPCSQHHGDSFRSGIEAAEALRREVRDAA